MIGDEPTLVPSFSHRDHAELSEDESKDGKKLVLAEHRAK
jgi:hypothetical protein